MVSAAASRSACRGTVPVSCTTPCCADTRSCIALTRLSWDRLSWTLDGGAALRRVVRRVVDPADDVANADWHRSVTDALTPFATGYYAREADVIDDAARARRSFAPAARARLADVRRAYDPAGLFHTVLDE